MKKSALFYIYLFFTLLILNNIVYNISLKGCDYL